MVRLGKQIGFTGNRWRETVYDKTIFGMRVLESMESKNLSNVISWKPQPRFELGTC